MIKPSIRAARKNGFDCSQVGRARREAIRRLDEFGCTVAEQLAAFSITKTTFHLWARDVRLRRRPCKRYAPGCLDIPIEQPPPGEKRKTLVFFKAFEKQQEEEPVKAMPASDALEIAILALLRWDCYSVSEIVEALKTSKSTVYRLKQADTGAEKRWHHRHIPSHTRESPPEQALAERRKHRCRKPAHHSSAS